MSFAFYVKAQCSFTISQLPNPACNQATLVATTIDAAQTVSSTCMASFSQVDLAQSFQPTNNTLCGAGIYLGSGSGSGTLTINLYNNLPTMGGTLMATGSVTLNTTGFYSVNWPSVSVTPGNTYYLVFINTGGLSSYCIGGSTSNPYAGGMTYANSGFSPFPSFDYTFLTTSCPGFNYAWSSGATSNSIIVNNSSVVNLTVSIPSTCTNSAAFTPTVNPSPTISVNSGSVCKGSTFTIVPSGASTYTIQGGSANVTPTVNTSYTVVGTSSAGCVGVNTATSSIVVNPIPTISVNSGTVCSGSSFSINPTGANTYTIQGGSANVTPTVNATYTVVGTSSAGCVSANTATSSITVINSPTITASSGTICSGQTYSISASGAPTLTFSSGSANVSPTITSSYTVTGTNSVGCIGSAISNVTVFANPIITAVSSSTNYLCIGSSATLTATGATSYSWNTSATTQTIVVNPTVTTSYSVSGTNTVGCNSNAIITQSVSNCTGLNETQNNNGYIVYPNPTKSEFFVEALNQSNEIYNVEIVDVLGKVIFKQNNELNNYLIKFNVENLNKGIYFVKITNNEKTNFIRLIKE